MTCLVCEAFAVLGTTREGWEAARQKAERLDELTTGHGRCDCHYAPCQHDLAARLQEAEQDRDRAKKHASEADEYSDELQAIIDRERGRANRAEARVAELESQVRNDDSPRQAVASLSGALAEARRETAEACAKEMDRMRENLLLGAGPDGWAADEETKASMRSEAVGYERAAGLLRRGEWEKHLAEAQDKGSDHD